MQYTLIGNEITVDNFGIDDKGYYASLHHGDGSVYVYDFGKWCIIKLYIIQRGKNGDVGGWWYEESANDL